MDSPDFAQLAQDRYEIADALHRFAAGLDRNDVGTLESALTEDCVIDFTAAAAKLGIQFPMLNGRAQVVQVLIPMLGPLDTSHAASNLQSDVRGDAANLRALMTSQHFMPGQGPKRGSDFALLMNSYQTELVRDGAQWRFRKIKIDNLWADGDPEILTALAKHRASKQAK